MSQILVVKRKYLEKLGLFEGIKTIYRTNDSYLYLPYIFTEGIYEFIDHEEAENNYDYKQIVILYQLEIHCRDNAVKRRYFSYKRHNDDCYSLAIVAHINKDDILNSIELNTYPNNNLHHVSKWRIPDQFLFDCCQKKIKQEFKDMIFVIDKRWVSASLLINNDLDDFGKKHFGWMCEYSVYDECDIDISKDTLNRDIQLISLRELNNNIDKYDNWSKILIDDKMTINL
jgi:predicted NUDIX family phosphoesterase